MRRSGECMHKQTLLRAATSQFTTNSPMPSQFAACWRFRQFPGWLQVDQRGTLAVLTAQQAWPCCLSMLQRCGVMVRGDTCGCTAVGAPQLVFQCLQHSQGTAWAQGECLCALLGQTEMSSPEITWFWEVTAPAKPGTTSRTRMHMETVAPRWELLQLSREDTKRSSGCQDLPETDCRVQALNFNSLSSSGGRFSLFSSSEELLKCLINFSDF